MKFHKPPGQKWLIHMLPGQTEMYLEELVQATWDTDFGLVIYHPDARNTMTVIPAHAITMVRSYGENEFRDRIAHLMGLPDSTFDSDFNPEHDSLPTYIETRELPRGGRSPHD